MRLLIIVLLLSSCQIQGNFKGLYSYRKELNGMKSVILSDDYSCDIEYSINSKVAIVNGVKMKECIQSKENILLYFWQPNCRSKNCVDINIIQEYCLGKNLDLYVIAEYYDKYKMDLNYVLENPIIGIDTYYYNTNLTSKYLKLFLVDIGMIETGDLKSSYYHFSKGLFAVWDENCLFF